MEKSLSKRDLALAIADHGGWEEFHQKRGNHYMYDYHKNRRLKLEKEYAARWAIRSQARSDQDP
jgi:hypothetical protein